VLCRETFQGNKRSGFRGALRVLDLVHHFRLISFEQCHPCLKVRCLRRSSASAVEMDSVDASVVSTVVESTIEYELKHTSTHEDKEWVAKLLVWQT